MGVKVSMHLLTIFLQMPLRVHVPEHLNFQLNRKGASGFRLPPWLGKGTMTGPTT